MNFPDLNGNEKLKNSLNELEANNRMPHAVIINGGNAEDRHTLAVHLSMWAVCTEQVKPCGHCKNCIGAAAQAHSDIYYAKGSGKTDIYSKEELGRIIEDSYIKPNQADKKVYIFEECDSKLTVISQNTLLKTLEEPPQDVMFILTCSNSRSLLPTIRSRASEFELESAVELNPDELGDAREIVLGIVEPTELRLLKAVCKLKKREQAQRVLDIVIMLLRDGLALYLGGKADIDPETAEALCRRLTKLHYIKLIELTQQAQDKIAQNVRPELIATCLCGEYRRILWQR